MFRRDFLQPTTTARTASLIAAAFQEEPTAPLVDAELLIVSRRAMATSFEVLLPLQWTAGPFAAEEALDLVDDLESQLTVYRDDSEVSQINQYAFAEAVPVESRLFELLEQSAWWTKETEGAFDLATGALIKTWGFYKRQGRVPTVAERIEAMQRTGMKYVILNRSDKTIRFLRSGLELNFGALGKGYTLDRVREKLQLDWNVPCGFLHGGRSSALAMGSLPGHALGWPVSIKHPWQETQTLGTVWLKNQGLGTSAATFQSFDYNGRKLGHLFDPRNGWPADSVAQVSVVAPTAAEADALSTAFFVQGWDFTHAYCQTHPEIGVILLPHDASVPVVWNLAPETFVLPS